MDTTTMDTSWIENEVLGDCGSYTHRPEIQDGKLICIRYSSNGVQEHVIDTQPDGWYEVSYSWGNQPAAAFVQFKGGQAVQMRSGVGDHTPEPTALKGIFTSQEDRNCLEYLAFDHAVEESQREYPCLSKDIEQAYARKQDPLPQMRRLYGGTWTYHDTYDGIDYNNIIFSDGYHVVSWNPIG